MPSSHRTGRAAPGRAADASPAPPGPRLEMWCALVWRTETENDAIRALARVVRDLGPLEYDG